MTTIQAAEEELARAMLAGDVAALNALIDDALSFIDHNGRRLTKTDDLATHASGLLRLERLDREDERITEWGDTAIVQVNATLAGHYADQPIAGAYAYTRLWRRTATGWRIAAAHCSALA